MFSQLCHEVNDSLQLCVAIWCVCNQVYDVCYSGSNKDNKQQLRAEDYIFLIGFLIAGSVTGVRFYRLVKQNYLLFVCV